jgi:hypothetical protein
MLQQSYILQIYNIECTCIVTVLNSVTLPLSFHQTVNIVPSIKKQIFTNIYKNVLATKE